MDHASSRATLAPSVQGRFTSLVAGWNLSQRAPAEVGAEGPGLSPALSGRAGLRLTIPIEPPVESLNATVAAALVLFEWRRRRLGS